MTEQTNPLPDTGFIRLKQLIGDKKATPPITAIYPVSKSTLWNQVKSGTFPRPVKLSPGVTAWPVEIIRKFFETKSKGEE